MTLAFGACEKGNKQMSRKRFSVEQIINHFREAEVLLSQGKTVGEICRLIGVSEQSYYLYGRLSRCKSTVGAVSLMRTSLRLSRFS